MFDAVTGAFRRSLTPTGLLGPRGIVTRSGRLFLVNQNVNTDFTGEVLRFNAGTGSPVTRLIPADNVPTCAVRAARHGAVGQPPVRGERARPGQQGSGRRGPEIHGGRQVRRKADGPGSPTSTRSAW